VTGRGSAKLILAGEHAVVYGHPAIAFAVDLHTSVRLRPHDAPTTVRSAHSDPRVRDALCTVLPGDGWQVEVASDIPVGRGMGSSAALAVALVRAHQPSLRGQALIDAAMPIERAFHGNPSGLDVVVSASGGCVWFRKGPPMSTEPLAPGAWTVVVLDSGEAGDTALQVAAVAEQMPDAAPILDAIGELVSEVRRSLADPEALGPLLDRNHELLARLGVSTPTLDELTRLARAHGAYGAKLAGAGGGGVVIALVDDPEPLLRAAAARGIAAHVCRPEPAR